jgi:hypothetical protein
MHRYWEKVEPWRSHRFVGATLGRQPYVFPYTVICFRIPWACRMAQRHWRYVSKNKLWCRLFSIFFSSYNNKEILHIWSQNNKSKYRKPMKDWRKARIRPQVFRSTNWDVHFHKVNSLVVVLSLEVEGENAVEAVQVVDTLGGWKNVLIMFRSA